jgi:hypothetical protein
VVKGRAKRWGTTADDAGRRLSEVGFLKWAVSLLVQRQNDRVERGVSGFDFGRGSDKGHELM